MRPHLHDPLLEGKLPQGTNPGTVPLPAIPCQVPVLPSKPAFSIQLVSRPSPVDPLGRAAPGKTRASCCESRIPMARAFSERETTEHDRERLSIHLFLFLRPGEVHEGRACQGGQSLSHAPEKGEKAWVALGRHELKTSGRATGPCRPRGAGEGIVNDAMRRNVVGHGGALVCPDYLVYSVCFVYARFPRDLATGGPVCVRRTGRCSPPPLSPSQKDSDARASPRSKS